MNRRKRNRQEPMESGETSHARTEISNHLWNHPGFEDHSVFALYSPFFVCLATGNLDPPDFYHYLNQELHFLRAFVQACEMAEESEKSKRRETAMRILMERERIKIEARYKFIQLMRFTLSDESTVIDNATKNCIDFLLGRVEDDGVPEELESKGAFTIVAIASYMRLYAHLCKVIKDVLNPDDLLHIYRKWFNDHSQQVCEESAHLCEGLLEYMSSSLKPEELKIVEKLYHQALKLNVEFFVAQPISQPTIAPLLYVNGDLRLAIFCAFDETCTFYNCNNLLASAAIHSAMETMKRGEAFHKSADELKGIWHRLLTAYGNQSDEWMKNKRNYSNATGRVFNYEGITKALEEIGTFQKVFRAKVEKFGLVKDLTLDKIRHVGQLVPLYNGCQRFLEKIVYIEGLRTDVHVLSLSWSGDLVKAAFSNSGGFDRVLNIHSNELAYEESVSTGKIVRKIESAMDRLKAMKVILNNIQLRDERTDHLKVYIGGTETDLLCLLEADIGIVIDPQHTLRGLGNFLGVSFVPLFWALVRKQKLFWGAQGSSVSSFRKPFSGVLYTVSGWSEIHAFILGL